MKNKKSITPEQAVAELNAKYPNDAKIIDNKVIGARQVEPKLNAEQAQQALRAIKQDEAKPVKEKKPSVVLERVSYLTPLIESGTHTQAELVEMMIKQFGLTQSTAQTFLTDSKNPRYSKFDRLVVVNEEGKLTFKTLGDAADDDMDPAGGYGLESHE